MAGRWTMSTRNFEAVKSNLRQYDQRARAAARRVVAESMDRTFITAQALCPRATGYMADNMRADLSPDGLAYQVGFREGDFVGQTNPATGQVITAFYPLYQEFGTSKMAAQPCIFPARDQERPRFRRELRAALRGANTSRRYLGSQRGGR
jgi:HK97 gp10 family phage protein